MRVLVTRALDDARLTALELASRGHQALVAPLFELRFIEGPEIVPDDVQAILATSANGVRALSRRSKQRNVQLFAVGSRTAAVARIIGFRDVIDAEGDSAALARKVLERLRPGAGSILLVAGGHSSPALATALGASGFDVHVCAVYEALAVSELPQNAREALGSNSLDATLLFSPRSARVFAELVQAAGLAAACTGLLACCISKPAAVALDGLQFGQVRIAARPDHDHLLALLDSDLPWNACRA